MQISFPQIAKFIIGTLLLIFLLDMSASYYNLLRYISFVGFISLAYYSYLDGDKLEIFIFVVLAFTLQPFIKFDFHIWIWRILYIVVGSYLIGSAICGKKRCLPSSMKSK